MADNKISTTHISDFPDYFGKIAEKVRLLIFWATKDTTKILQSTNYDRLHFLSKTAPISFPAKFKVLLLLIKELKEFLETHGQLQLPETIQHLFRQKLEDDNKLDLLKLFLSICQEFEFSNLKDISFGELVFELIRDLYVENVKMHFQKALDSEQGITSSSINDFVTQLEKLLRSHALNDSLVGIEDKCYCISDVENITNDPLQASQSSREKDRAFLETRLFDKKSYISTGFPTLDDKLGGGLPIGEITVLGGFSRHGKSTIAMNIAIAAAKDYPTLFYPLDPPDAERVLRNIYQVLRERRFRNLADFYQDYYRNLNTYIDLLPEKIPHWILMNPVMMEHPPLKILTDLDSILIALKNIKGPGLMVIDYVQVIRDLRESQDTRVQCFDLILGKLKLAAYDNNIAILLLSQITRPPRGFWNYDNCICGPDLDTMYKGTSALMEEAAATINIHYCNLAMQAVPYSKIDISQDIKDPFKPLKLTWEIAKLLTKGIVRFSVSKSREAAIDDESAVFVDMTDFCAKEVLWMSDNFFEVLITQGYCNAYGLLEKKLDTYVEALEKRKQVLLKREKEPEDFQERLSNPVQESKEILRKYFYDREPDPPTPDY